MLAEWDHPQEQAKAFQGQIAYDRNRVKEAEEKIALGRKAEAEGNLDAAISHYAASLEIQKDAGLQAAVEKLRKTPSRPGQASQTGTAGSPPRAETTATSPASSTSGGSPVVTSGHGHTGGAPPVIYTPTAPTPMGGGGKMILDENTGPYQWIEATEVQTRVVHSGRAAFRSTGNNHFTHRLGLVGNYPGMYRYLDLWLWFDKPGADIQIQVQVDGRWGKRWGFEAGPKYDGYAWPMEGTTVNQPTGRWVNLRLDLIEQLKIHAGQAITGLAFSSDHGDVYYDAVQLLPSGTPLPLPVVRTTGKQVLEDDAGPYKWVEATQVQREVVANGQAAFRSTGNNHFLADLGRVGDYPELFRSLSFWAFFIGPEADIQLQVQVDGIWGKRWGYEAGPKYDGYGWAMEGTTVNLRPGIWQEIRIDLMRDLKINPGQKITGLAFSSDHGDVYFDAVYLQPNLEPARKPGFRPAGKLVLEDDPGPYNWIERSELQGDLVFRGSKAFRSTGNNHFLADLGVAGNAAGQFRSLGFWAFFMGPKADLQLQVQVNGQWGKRWGFDAGPKYDGYGWAMEGTTANMPSGRWTWIQVDLLDQLKLKPGDRITGLAFSSDNGDVIYDSVWLVPSNTRPDIGAGGEAGTPGGTTTTVPPAYLPPGGRDYTHEGSGNVGILGGQVLSGGVRPAAASAPTAGYLRLEACVDGSDWIRIGNGRLTHEHRAFEQIGTHPSCPASHQVAGGGFLVDGQVVSLKQLPWQVGLAGIGRIEVERGRGAVHMDGPNRILIDDDGPGGPSVYVIRIYPGAAASGAVASAPGGRDYTAPTLTTLAPGEFVNPQVDGVALDICREWGANCGKPAADAFCQSQSYSHSLSHREQHDTPPTRVIGSGQLCDQSFCDRIVWIQCAGAAPTPSAQPRIVEFSWHGMDEDRVGEWGQGKPNGVRDGRFRLVLEAPGRFGIASLSVWSANEKGEKAGGQIWHSRNTSNWMLGVFRGGHQLNPTHVPSLGEFDGRVVLDLYANSSGWFNPGHWFLLEVEGSDGKVLRQTLRLGEAVPGGRDYTYQERPVAPATPPPNTKPAAGGDGQSLEEAARQLKDAVKELKNLFKW